VSSISAKTDRIWGNVRYYEGDWQVPDIFLLATDALAHWFLIQHERGEKPWKTLQQIQDQDDFAGFVEQLRRRGELVNDDTTLVLIGSNSLIGDDATSEKSFRGANHIMGSE